MKKIIIFNFIFSVLFLLTNCQAQSPNWVQELAISHLELDIKSIDFWEEKEITFYEINAKGDSIKVNALFVKGTTNSGEKFIGKIPQTNKVSTPVGIGVHRIAGESCTGKCGCECCNFKVTARGCECTGVSQCCDKQDPPCTNCWCSHKITKD